jgi:hypothetical protein
VQFGQLHVEQNGSHFGVQILPIQNEMADLEHTRSDDEFVQSIGKLIHTEATLTVRPKENGIVISESSDVSVAGIAASPFVLELEGSGEMSGRLRIGWRKAFRQDVEDLANLLSITFNIAAQMYQRKRFGPMANVRIVISHPNKSDRLISVLPEIHDLSTDIDLSMDFPEAFGRFVERLWALPDQARNLAR